MLFRSPPRFARGSGCFGDCCKNARKHRSTPLPCHSRAFSDAWRGTFATVSCGVRRAPSRLAERGETAPSGRPPHPSRGGAPARGGRARVAPPKPPSRRSILRLVLFLKKPPERHFIPRISRACNPGKPAKMQGDRLLADGVGSPSVRNEGRKPAKMQGKVIGRLACSLCPIWHSTARLYRHPFIFRLTPNGVISYLNP